MLLHFALLHFASESAQNVIMGFIIFCVITFCVATYHIIDHLFYIFIIITFTLTQMKDMFKLDANENKPVLDCSVSLLIQ